MGTITFSTTDDTNLRDKDGTDIASMAVNVGLFTGSVGSLTYEAGTATSITSGELTFGTASTGSYVVVVDDNAGASLGAYEMTAV